MSTKVLLVCTGNICRSPMAEGLLKAKLGDRGCIDVSVSSAGTWANYGHHPTIEAIQAAGERGADISEHRSSPVLLEALEEADLIIAMTSVHLRELAALAPQHVEKTRLLKEIPELVTKPASGSAAARLGSLLRGTRPASRRDLDLDDPIGLPLSAYDRCADQIDGALEVLVEQLCPESKPP